MVKRQLGDNVTPGQNNEAIASIGTSRVEYNLIKPQGDGNLIEETYKENYEGKEELKVVLAAT